MALRYKIKGLSKYGYPKGEVQHSDLIHRQIAYAEIYLKNRDKYPYPFSRYIVHHKDKDKENFNLDNLDLLTPRQHRIKHIIEKKAKEKQEKEEKKKLRLKIIRYNYARKKSQYLKKKVS